MIALKPGPGGHGKLILEALDEKPEPLSLPWSKHRTAGRRSIVPDADDLFWVVGQRRHGLERRIVAVQCALCSTYFNDFENGKRGS